MTDADLTVADAELTADAAGPSADNAGPSGLGHLVCVAVALGAPTVAGWSEAETALISRHDTTRSRHDTTRSRHDTTRSRHGITRLAHTTSSPVAGLRERIEAGEDPLGEEFARLLTPRQRRPLGQTYTPAPIVAAMVGWAQDQGVDVARIVDPGVGSGRYLLAAGHRFPGAELVGCEIDPLSALLARANLAAAGLAQRARVIVGDFRDLALPPVAGPTLYLGNPPYVRHHQIPSPWKRWLVQTARTRGLAASGLAGLHVHFFLAVAAQGAPGDLGAFITSAEWLDVNYGSLVRDLLLGDLGGTSLHVLSPQAVPFADAITTGAITCFRLGERPSRITVRQVASVAELGRLSGGRQVPRQHLAETSRWSVLTGSTPKLPPGHVELGELFRVHRGAVTGANSVWVTHPDQTALPPSLLYRAVTRAKELFDAGERLRDARSLRVVIGLPVDLDILDSADRDIVLRFLASARERNVHRGYIASTRKAWWSVQLRDPAPILATYMARRPPAFVRNDVAARHINIAHGLYPRQPLEPAIMDRITAHLRTAVTLAQGRTYAGGLTKFEPKEMERLPIPSLPLLTSTPS